MNSDQLSEFSTLFDYAKDIFSNFVAELASYGLETDPLLEIKKGVGLLCYYDHDTGHIYISLPDPKEPEGKLHALFFRSLLGLESNEELLALSKILLPRLIAHEMGHYYRHKAGLFGNDLWQEEQIANHLANALTKHRYIPNEKDLAVKLIKKAINSLSSKMKSSDAAVDSYYSSLQALNVLGILNANIVSDIEMIDKLFSINSEEMLRESGHLSKDMLNRLNCRKDVIKEFNDEYTSNVLEYIYYQLGWMLLDIESREHQYIEDFIRVFLNYKVSLLPVIEKSYEPNENDILSCYIASDKTKDTNKTLSRYFYKRYRSLILRKLEIFLKKNEKKENFIDIDAINFLENWDDKEPETLNYLMLTASPELRVLFPQKIEKKIAEIRNFKINFTNITDLKLWNYIAKNENDENAKNTLCRLELLDKADIFRTLPSEFMLELIQDLCRIKLVKGETLIWEKSHNDDVYIVISGCFEVLTGICDNLDKVGFIKPGEIFGEISFFTQESRSATVRAVEPSECYVIKASTLRLHSFRHPAILMQMAKVIAKRLIAKEKKP